MKNMKNLLLTLAVLTASLAGNTKYSSELRLDSYKSSALQTELLRVSSERVDRMYQMLSDFQTANTQKRKAKFIALQ